MTLTSLMDFIDTSLFENGSFELSYKDPNQKWIIRDHLLKLLQDFPSFIPSIDSFVEIDGTTMNLININGYFHVSDFFPEVPLIIWVHENYPSMSPMIFIPSNLECPIDKNHPYIDQSGLVTPPYMLTWDPRKSNICELVHNLKGVFQHDHPSMCSSSLKGAILDDIVAKICGDLEALDVKNRYEIDRLSNEQSELQRQGENLDGKISYEEEKKDKLEKRVEELREYNGKLLDWINYNENRVFSMDHLLDFQGFGKKSQKVECLAEERAIEDAIYALDKALEEGVISLDVYLKQIRVLAREQFYHRAMILKLKLVARS